MSVMTRTIIFFIIFSGVGLSPQGIATTSGLLYKPQMINEGDCGAIGGMKIGRGKPKYSENTCPSATLSTTNPTWQTRARTRAAAVGSQRLTAWAMARPMTRTNSIDQKPSWITDERLGGQGILRSIWNPSVYYRSRNSPSLDPVLSHFNPVGPPPPPAYFHRSFHYA
jgi:hypothetical protein